MAIKRLTMKGRNTEHRVPVVSTATYHNSDHKADLSVNLGY